MVTMKVQGKRRRETLNKRWLDNIREDMKKYNITKDMAENRSAWHMKSKADTILHDGGIYVRKVIHTK